MLRLCILLLTLMLSAVMARAATCGETQPCEEALRLGKIRSVTVIKAWARSSVASEQKIDCRRFYLTPRRVRYYLERAGRITENARHYATDDSPCYAHGTLVTTKGERWSWYIGMLREAELRRAGRPAIHLYCSRCRASPFVR